MDAARPAPSTTAVYASVEGSTGNESSTSLRTTIRQIKEKDASHSQDASVEGSTGSESSTSLHTTFRQMKEKDASHSQDASVEGSTGSESSTLLRATFRQIKEKLIRRNYKRLIVGTRVSIPHGKLVQNPKGHGRRVRDLIIGFIVVSCNDNKYKVKFDNGTVKECSSSSLKI